MVTARDPAVPSESGSGSPSWNSHATTGHGSSESNGQSDKPCYWVNIWTRLNAMRNCLQLCDIDLETEDGSAFRAHSAVLAASSDAFHGHLMSKKSSVLRDAGNNKVLIQGVSGPALKVTLDFVYGITPTNPEELSLLLEGSQVMGISGALAFCKRHGVLVRNGDAVSPKSTVEAGNKAAKSTTGSHESRQTTNGVDSLQMRNDIADNHVNPHGDFVLDLSFNDLQSMSKCPVLKELASEEAEDAADGLPPDNQHLVSGDVDCQQDGSRSVCEKPRSDSLNLDGSDSVMPMDAVNNQTEPAGSGQESGAAQMCVTDDLDIDDLSCPFAKSAMYDGKCSEPDRGSSTDCVGDVDKMTAEAVLHCPFLKSLGDMPPDAMMKADEEDEMQKKLPYCAPGKTIRSLEPPSVVDLREADQCGKLASFATNQSDSSDLLSASGWQDLTGGPRGQNPTISQVTYNQYDVGGFLNGKTTVLPDDKVQNVCNAGGGEQLSVSCAAMSHSQVSQSVLGETIPAVSSQRQLSPSQSVANVPMNQLDLSESLVGENPISSFGRQYEVTRPVFNDNFASIVNENSSNFDGMVSPRQELFISCGPVESQETQSGSTSRPLSANNSFVPDVCAESDVSFYQATVSTGSTCGSSLVDLIYCNVSDSGCPPEGSSLACAQVSSTTGVALSRIGAQAKPVQSVLPSPDQRCHSTVMSPEGSRHQSVVSPETDSSSRMASPGALASWDATSCLPLDNTTIKAKLKLNRGQEYICLIENCCYSNKCLDYMQSHMYRKHGMGRPDVTCPLCQKAFFSLGQLKGHTKRAHKPETRASDVEAVRCEDCNEMFTNMQKLQTHRLKSHCKGRLFTCEECDFRSPRKKDVQAHMVSQHKKIPPGVQVFECVHCDYKCTDKNRAEEHQAMHTGQPKFVCKICGKSYTTRRGMRTHMQYHSTERPHRCEMCNAAFKVRSKLRDHVRLVHTHVGVKPYQCGYCGHKTALRGNCNQHCRKHHPELPVCVIDHQQGERRNKRAYDYAGLKGEGIEECRDVRKHLRAVSP